MNEPAFIELTYSVQITEPVVETISLLAQVMSAKAKGLTEQERQSIAAWFVERYSVQPTKEA